MLFRSISRTTVHVMARDGTKHVLQIETYAGLEGELARLRGQGVEIADLELERPDLEQVFLKLTGRDT